MIGEGDPFYLKFWVKLTALDYLPKACFMAVSSSMCASVIKFVSTISYNTLVEILPN